MKNKNMRPRKKEESEPVLEGGWVYCSECSVRIRRENMKRHMKRVHGKDVPQGSETGKKGKKMTRGTLAFMAIVVVAIVVAAIVSYTVIYPAYKPTDPNNGNPPSPPPPPPGYTPVHGIGNGADAYWTVYPLAHVSAGSVVPIPVWATELASSKVLLICDHSIGCTPCDMQTKDITAIMGNSKYINSVTHIDLISTSSDPKAAECFDVFDPDGTRPTIPLTIIVTMNPSGGYIWHSWEGVTGKANLETWLNDAIHYHGG